MEPTQPDAREDLLRHYRWLRRYGLNDSHSGNASVRDGQRLWITPTGACADTLQARDLIEGGPDGVFAPGASFDAAVHAAIYRDNPRAGAVLHSHGPHSVGITLAAGSFEPPDFEGRLYFPHVPVIEIDFDDYGAQAPAAIVQALREAPIAVVRGHGVYAWGESLNRAYKWTCSLELSARTAHIARLHGGPA
jgi:L-fuculose-phosphate aldolase